MCSSVHHFRCLKRYIKAVLSTCILRPAPTSDFYKDLANLTAMQHMLQADLVSKSFCTHPATKLIFDHTGPRQSYFARAYLCYFRSERSLSILAPGHWRQDCASASRS